METDDSLVIPEPSPEDLKPTLLYMEKVIRMCRTVNMWPNAKKGRGCRHSLLIVLITIISFIHMLAISLEITKIYKDLDTSSFLTRSVMAIMCTLFRYINTCVRGDKYLTLVSLIHNNFVQYSLFPKKERLSLLKYYKLANRLIMGFGIITFLWIIQLLMTPVFAYLWEVLKSSNTNDTQENIIEYPIPLKVYAPFDYGKQPANVLYYVYECISIIIIVWLYILVDSFWYMVIYLTIGQFVLIKESVNTIAEILKAQETTEGFQILNENEYKQVEERLKQCIKHHQFTRNFVGKLDELSSPNVMVDSLYVMICIGFILFEMNIALDAGDWNRVQHSVEYFLSMTMHLFVFNWLGNELTAKEEELAEAIQQIPWYSCGRLKPLFLLMTIQARRPCKLTGGKLYKLSLEFFTSVMHVGFSYFTFFRHLRNNPGH